MSFGGSNEWDTPRPPSFCEGKLWDQVIPGINEFSSGLSGFVICAIAIVGLAQKRLEVVLKLMYASLFVSGIGTILLHWHRIAAFNLADVFPLLLTLSFGLVAFFDEIVYEVRRRRGPEGDVLEDQPTEFDTIRTAFDGIFYIIIMLYLVIGLIVLIYSTYEGIFGLYFGIPFGTFAIGGMAFVGIREKRRGRPKSTTLLWLFGLGTGFGILSIVFKLIDSAACNKYTIWLFPHSFWHIFVTYATHCVITFLAFNRMDNYYPYNRNNIKILWYFKFYPFLYVPTVLEVEREKEITRRASLEEVCQTFPNKNLEVALEDLRASTDSSAPVLGKKSVY